MAAASIFRFGVFQMATWRHLPWKKIAISVKQRTIVWIFPIALVGSQRVSDPTKCLYYLLQTIKEMV